jgi:hypothetical protein
MSSMGERIRSRDAIKGSNGCTTGREDVAKPIGEYELGAWAVDFVDAEKGPWGET